MLRSERTRIVEAAARCCARSGFVDATIEEILADAGLSREVFDRFFSDKEECFLAALNTALTEIFRLTSLAFQTDKPLIDQVDDGVAGLLELTVAQPSYATIGFIESRVAGERSRAIYSSGSRILTSMLDMQRPFLPAGASVPPTAAQAAFGGPYSLICRELAAGRAAQLPYLLPDFLYAVHVPFFGIGEALRRARLAEEKAAPTAVPRPEAIADDSRELHSPLDRPQGTIDADAARLLGAAIEIAGEKGYAGLTEEALLERAGVARTVVDAHFAGIRGCFVAAWLGLCDTVAEMLAERWLAAGGWPDRVRACLEALLSWAADEPTAARALIVEIQAAGPAAHRLYRETLDRLVPFLDQGRDWSPTEEELPARVAGLALGGAEMIAFDEIVAGRTADLPHLLPDLLFAVLVPFLGPGAASEHLKT